mmetsp:Transcript_15465/g.52156  ORF Transcript_15465/g.52156 Transcript_15465/m.52156 type:complete len:227 (-) Transcript_15465:316-996(-)
MNAPRAETFLPAEEADCMFATKTSSGMVVAAERKPPASEAAMRSLKARDFRVVPRPKQYTSMAFTKAYLVPQSAVLFKANVPAPLKSVGTPSFKMRRKPTLHDSREDVSADVEPAVASLNAGSVMTRVFSSSVGDRTKPWTPPAAAPAKVSHSEAATPYSLAGAATSCVTVEWAQPNTAPLLADCTKPHGKKPSQRPATPFVATMPCRIEGYGAWDVCFRILTNSN